MDKTVKDLAQELRITVQAVYSRMKKLDPADREAHTFKRDNRTYITPAGQDLIRGQVDPQETPQTRREAEAAAELIEALKDENKHLKEQIKIKDEQIHTAQFVAAQAQQSVRDLTARLPAGEPQGSNENDYSKIVQEFEQDLNTPGKEPKARRWRGLRGLLKRDD